MDVFMAGNENLFFNRASDPLQSNITNGQICKAIPQKDCATDAQSNFSSDCTKSSQNAFVFREIFV